MPLIRKEPYTIHVTVKMNCKDQKDALQEAEFIKRAVQLWPNVVQVIIGTVDKE